MEGMGLKAALVGQVVDGQAAARIGVHAKRPAEARQQSQRQHVATQE
jgi:hypothetical protein